MDFGLLTNEQLQELLRAAPKQGKSMLLLPSKEFPVGILEDTDVSDNLAEVHAKEADLWLGLEGEIEFIVDGKKIIVRKGDWLYIPAGVPHQHNKPAGTARLAIIKIPA